jgi:hypothetical protein
MVLFDLLHLSKVAVCYFDIAKVQKTILIRNNYAAFIHF